MLLKSSSIWSQRMASTSQKIGKVIIANRGEIALRVIRTARKLGIECIAVYSDVDRDAQHVRLADKAYHIGEASPLKSYLCSDKVIDVALRSGGHAIHPGYGFLSENADFAEKCEKAGLIFIGPSPQAIRAMGMKNMAKKIMMNANVPVIQGYNESNQDTEFLYEEAKKIGFPVMIKAVCGGGGKGMRIARSVDDFHQALESARSEASKAFNNSDMIMEKYVERPRHVEVQVFGDSHDNYVYLWERDCSLQRRHQKIIEEAPAFGLSSETRRQIGEAGAAAARAVQYTGAGTVEFIMDPITQKFYFMEMNTRLQVEHPITEAITNIDLVEWQFSVAEGNRLPLTQPEIGLNGHAMEARIYAEDSEGGFMPAAGKLEYLSFPNNVRVDSGVVEGDEVSVHYDPMIAKVVVHGADRNEAIACLDAALRLTQIGGLINNVDFVRKCLHHREFMAGNVYTDFIQDHEHELLPILEGKKKYSETTILEGVCAKLLLHSSKNRGLGGPFSEPSFFRINHDAKIKIKLDKNVELPVVIKKADTKSYVLIVDDKELSVSNIQHLFTLHSRLPKVEFSIEADGCHWTVSAVQLQDTLAVYGLEQAVWSLSAEVLDYSHETNTNVELLARSPMPGIIDRVHVKVGDVVKAGEALVVMIAMKMEYVLKAPFNCKIEAIMCEPGSNVVKNATLVKYAKVDNN